MVWCDWRPVAISIRTPRPAARAALGWVLAVVSRHANATMRYQARKVDIIATRLCAAHARAHRRAADSKDFPMSMIGAEVVVSFEKPRTVLYRCRLQQCSSTKPAAAVVFEYAAHHDPDDGLTVLSLTAYLRLR